MDPDDDGDGIATLEEIALSENDGVKDTDIDGDLIPQWLDDDDDGDGIPTKQEIEDSEALGRTDVDLDGTYNWYDTDSDGDDVLDKDESDDTDPADGVPDYLKSNEADADGDGVSDAVEELFGSNLHKTDTDGDGINDYDEFRDARMLRETDMDGDGIRNWLDTDSDGDYRTDKAEGLKDEDEDGIPAYLDISDVRVVVEGDISLGKLIQPSDKIQFLSGKAIFKEESKAVLFAIADYLQRNPAITKMSISGHTDSAGNEAANHSISVKRAEAALQFLIDEAGIEADRLVAIGYGETLPIDTNDTAEGRANNRRIDFIIMEVN